MGKVRVKGIQFASTNRNLTLRLLFAEAFFFLQRDFGKGKKYGTFLILLFVFNTLLGLYVCILIFFALSTQVKPAKPNGWAGFLCVQNVWLDYLVEESLACTSLKGLVEIR